MPAGLRWERRRGMEWGGEGGRPEQSECAALPGFELSPQNPSSPPVHLPSQLSLAPACRPPSSPSSGFSSWALRSHCSDLSGNAAPRNSPPTVKESFTSPPFFFYQPLLSSFISAFRLASIMNCPGLRTAYLPVPGRYSVCSFKNCPLPVL